MHFFHLGYRYNFCGATHGNELHNTQEIMFSQHMRGLCFCIFIVQNVNNEWMRLFMQRFYLQYECDKLYEENLRLMFVRFMIVLWYPV